MLKRLHAFKGAEAQADPNDGVTSIHQSGEALQSADDVRQQLKLSWRKVS